MERLAENFMIAAAAQIERIVHTYAWDQGQVFGVLQHLPTGGMRFSPIDCSQVPDELVPVIIVQLLHQDSTGVDMFRREFPHLVALGFSAEAWSVSADNAIEGRSFADTPGRFEGRLVNVIDFWGRIFRVDRIRGYDPDVYQDQRDEALDAPSVQAMIEILLMIADQLPNNTEMMDHLSARRRTPVLDGPDATSG